MCVCVGVCVCVCVCAEYVEMVISFLPKSKVFKGAAENGVVENGDLFDSCLA